jgi:hypothetical protein
MQRNYSDMHSWGSKVSLLRFVFNANQRDPIRHRDVMPTPAASGAVDSFVVVPALRVIYIRKAYASFAECNQWF